MGKIIFIGESLDKLGGIERVINTLANNLSKRYEVEAISYSKNRDKPFFTYNSNIKFVTIIDNTNLKSTKFRHNKAMYLLMRAVEKTNNFLKSLYYVKKYTKQFCEDDILVFGRVEMALTFLPYIKKVKKIIVREASHIYNHKNLDYLKKQFLGKVDLFIVSSDENINEYNKLFDNMLTIKKIYNPLGIEPRGGVDSDSKVVISVGRYALQKGFDVLLRSWVTVVKKNPDWKLKILGDGYYKEQMEKMINELNIYNNVELVPNNPDVVSELEKASIFVMTSRIEGYANALVEAMACGLACVSFDWVMGVNDIIKQGSNGLIVPLVDRKKYMNYSYWNLKDVDNMADAINNLIMNKELRHKLGREATKIIDSRKQDIIIKKWEDYILK